MQKEHDALIIAPRFRHRKTKPTLKVIPNMETFYIVQFKNALTNDKWAEYSRHDDLETAKKVMDGNWHTPHRLLKATATVLEEKGANA